MLLSTAYEALVFSDQNCWYLDAIILVVWSCTFIIDLSCHAFTLKIKLCQFRRFYQVAVFYFFPEISAINQVINKIYANFMILLFVVLNCSVYGIR